MDIAFYLFLSLKITLKDAILTERQTLLFKDFITPSPDGWMARIDLVCVYGCF